MFLSESTVVGEQILHHPVACLVLGDTTTIDSFLVLVVHTCTCEVATLGRAEVQTDIDAVAQTLNPWAFHLAEESVVGTDTFVLIEPDVLVSLHRLLGDHSLVVGGKGDEALEVAIGIIRAGERALAQYAVHIVHTLCGAIAGVGAQSEAEPLAHHLVEIATDGDTVVFLCRNRRLIMIVTCAEAITAAVGTACHTHVVVVAHTSLIVKVLPVGIGVVVLIKRIFVETGKFPEFRKSRTVHHRILVEHLLETYISVIGHLSRSALVTFHCGNDNHTVGTTRTVDGSGGSILENVHRLDVGGVDVRKLSHEGDSVEHDERVVGSTQ